MLNLFFCFRWLLIMFKREFSLPEIMLLWEVIWACPFTPKFHLFFSIAILEQIRDDILSQNMMFDDLLKYINELSLKLNMDDLLRRAEVLLPFLSSLATSNFSLILTPL